MNVQLEVAKEISRLCGMTNQVSSLGWHFIYNNLHYFYIPDSNHNYIRIIIPHILKIKQENKDEVVAAINETNRTVKFIKAVILNNGSVAISYDHRLAENENIAEIVSHIIKTVDFASAYLKKKISECFIC